MQVPCVAAVENMSYFDGDDGKRYFPFGSGSGERVRDDFGVPHLLRFPISSAISSAGDGVPPPHLLLHLEIHYTTKASSLGRAPIIDLAAAQMVTSSFRVSCHQRCAVAVTCVAARAVPLHHPHNKSG